jgi:hypothetical protein
MSRSEKKKKAKPPRGPCCAKVWRRDTLAILSCSTKNAPLRTLSGMLTSVTVFICARHLQRADIRDCKVRDVLGGVNVE